MKVIDSCAECLLERQIAKAERANNPEKRDLFVQQVKELIDNRTDEDCSPYLVSLFNELYKECFGDIPSFAEIKKEYNDLVMTMEADIERMITCGDVSSREQLERAFCYARIGNYIDFGAMNHVDRETFLALFEDAKLSASDRVTFEQFYSECERAKRFLLIVDNCGEVVLDKLFLRTLKSCFPSLKVQVLVRGEEVLNDATMEDAKYVGLVSEAEVISNGTSVAGTIYRLLTEEAKAAMDHADVILAKGQGNYESMSGEGRHVFYAFLCKCELFTTRFEVPHLTGMFVVE